MNAFISSLVAIAIIAVAAALILDQAVDLSSQTVYTSAHDTVRF